MRRNDSSAEADSAPAGPCSKGARAQTAERRTRISVRTYVRVVLDVASGKYIRPRRAPAPVRKVSGNIFRNACKGRCDDIFLKDKSRLPCIEFSYLDSG